MKKVSLREIYGLQDQIQMWKGAVDTFIKNTQGEGKFLPERDNIFFAFYTDMGAGIVDLLKLHVHQGQRDLMAVNVSLSKLQEIKGSGLRFQHEISNLADFFDKLESLTPRILEDTNAITGQGITSINYDPVWQNDDISYFVSEEAMKVLSLAENVTVTTNLVNALKSLSLELPEAGLFYSAKAIEGLINRIFTKESWEDISHQSLGEKINSLLTHLSGPTEQELTDRLKIINKYGRIPAIHDLGIEVDLLGAQQTLVGDVCRVIEGLASKIIT